MNSLIFATVYFVFYQILKSQCSVVDDKISGITVKEVGSKSSVPEMENAHKLHQSLDLPGNISLEAEFLQKSKGTPTIKTIQSTYQNKNCYQPTLMPMLELLKNQGINVKEKDVENTEISGGQISLDDTELLRLYFETVLNMKTLLPSDEKVKRTYKRSKYNQKELNVSPFKSIDFNLVERANLLITTKNLNDEGKSRIKIRIEIDRDTHFQNGMFETHAHSSYEDILNRLFERNKWNKSLKLQKFEARSTYLGLLLALIASTLCGWSFVLKKRSLLKMDKTKAYFQNKGWWMAHSLMVVGDILHFIAFFFAPAVLICTLQMLMVLVTAAASTTVLGEKINNYWKLAFASSLGGCLVILVHVPKEPHISNIETFLYMVTAPSFMAYSLVLFLASIIMMVFIIPKWGQINSLAYTLQSAIFGSVAVIALKGVILTFRDRLFHWLPITCLTIVAVCLLLQLDYLNRALSYYNTLVVTTQYYVLYSALVILGSSLLFEVWKSSSDETILLISLGYTTIALGVLIFAIFQEENATFDFTKFFEGPDIKSH